MINKERILFLVTSIRDGDKNADLLNELLDYIHHDSTGTTARIIHEFHSLDAVTEENYNYTYWDTVVCEVLDADKINQEIVSAPNPVIEGKMIRKMAPVWWAAAATVIAIAGYAVFTNFTEKSTQNTSAIAYKNQDVPAGKNGAILTLADGTQIVLDSIDNETINIQKGAAVTVTNNELNYLSTNQLSGDVSAVTYNTLNTPRGRQFSLTLSDGSKVWLNASSTIRYPTTFSGTHRKVELVGEAYFEIVRNSSQPFTVKVHGGTEVEVLGTSFNINAYDDEKEVKTTLLDGAVKVVNIDASVILKPGEQARTTSHDALSGITLAKQVDLKQVIAWKNGAFVFNNADITEVMRQLSRWYDVEVEYRGQTPKDVFNGKIGRGLSLSQVLEGLEATNLKFKIEGGNKIIVLP